MNRYRYEAADAQGRIVNGLLEADSPGAVMAQLRALGLTALEVEA
ncbi:type II secretion system protein GspF, partial [Pseudomonas sp. GD03867]|nr:type II secretion system protein GspF [Pseudomonas sp. GD03867]